LTCALTLLAAVGACDDDEKPADLDSTAGGDSNQTGDFNKTGDGTKGEGWTSNDGPVKVTDSQVVVTNDSGGKWVCNITKCGGKPQQCGDCIDNDGDGKVDYKDPECLGPCDNTEGPALIGGIGGQTSSNCVVDCYFDYGNGAGNDQCWWDHRCDPLEPEKAWGCTYDAKLLGTNKCPKTQPKQCTDYCLPYTPNGCDCWGCCTFPALKGLGPGGSDGYVWIGAMDPTTKKGTCTLKDVLDQTKCPRCTPIQACNNPCGHCEICIGKPTLPPDCYKKPDAGPGKDSTVPQEAGVPPTQQCPGGEQPCGLPGQAPCQAGYYCISGCCIKVTIN
jgi:hypothetical protein